MTLEKLYEELKEKECFKVTLENDKLIITYKENIKEKLLQRDLIIFAQTYDKGAEISEQNNKILIKTNNLTAQKLAFVLATAFSDEYKFLIKDSYLIEAIPKTAKHKSTDILDFTMPGIKAEAKDDKFLEIANFINLMGFDAEIYNDRIEVKTNEVDTVAQKIDEEFPDVEIIIRKDKVIIKP